MSTSPVTCAIAELLIIGTGEGVVPPVERGDEARVRALIEAARVGDREAFGEIVTLFQRVVFRTALAALGNRDDAEDAAQDAFVAAWQKLPGFRGDASIRTWLLTIVWRKAIDRRRMRRMWWTRTSTSAASCEMTDDPLDAVAACDASPERQAISRDLEDHIRAEISRLSPTLRDTLLLAATGDHAYEDIAAMLRAPVGTIKWRVSEARRVIAARLAARGVTWR